MIHAIFKDSKGMMWIGTGAGLCRFDGKEFRIFGSNEGLAGDNVFSITEDDQGNLWVGCMNAGISKFDGTTFTNFTEREGLVSNNVRVVWYSAKFRLLFVGTNDGCSVFDGRKFRSISGSIMGPDYNLFFVMGFLEGNNCVNVYTYHHNSYYKYYPASHEFVRVSDAFYEDHNSSASPVILSNGDTIIGSRREGINIQNHGLKKSFQNLGQVFDLEPDNEGNV
ncbi:MAG TPA: two-component regulator propeller domain-containing protein, partial [Methanosarcina sp.]|nr:two-component regulator propeller domain-containing protein [Methanosarcina sp.]